MMLSSYVTTDHPVSNTPLTIRSVHGIKTKKICPAAAAELAAAATATVKYDKWKRVPRKLDHLHQYPVIQRRSFSSKQVLSPNESERGEMEETSLQEKIDDAYKALVKMKLREKYQLEVKLRLCEEIDRKENNTWENANVMLRKYERLKCGILRIHKNFQKDFDNEQKELLNMKKETESKIKGIENELNLLDSFLEDQNTEYTELINYKHQQYPLKALIIEGLERDIAGIKTTHEEEERQIKHVMTSQMEEYQQKLAEQEDDITKFISKRSFHLMTPAVKQMLLENALMEKEIKFHLKAKEEMEKEVKSLSDQIKQLSRDPLSNYRLQMFPEFFLKDAKCKPDSDLGLNIAHQTFIPI